MRTIAAHGAAIAVISGSSTMQIELLLFGGHNHKVFLGCLTCNQYDAGSVFNRVGDPESFRVSD